MHVEHKLRNIVVPVDVTPAEACLLADRLAKPNRATVHIFSTREAPAWPLVWDIPGGPPLTAERDWLAGEIEARSEVLAAIARGLESETQVSVCFGDAQESFVKFLDDAAIDLAIMSHRGVGFWSRMFHTNLTGHVISNSHVPVLALGEGHSTQRLARRGIRRILVAASDHRDAAAASAFAAVMALPAAEIILAHVASTIGGDGVEAESPAMSRARAQTKLEQLVGLTTALPTQTVTGVLVENTGLESLFALAERYGADLIVVGSRPHRSMGDRLLGTNADRLLSEATDVPVLVVPRTAPLPIDEAAPYRLKRSPRPSLGAMSSLVARRHIRS